MSYRPRVGDNIELSDAWRQKCDSPSTPVTRSVVKVTKGPIHNNLEAVILYGDIGSFTKGAIKTNLNTEGWCQLYHFKKGDIVISNNSIYDGRMYKILVLEDQEIGVSRFHGQCLESNRLGILDPGDTRPNFTYSLFDLHTSHFEVPAKLSIEPIDIITFKKGDLVSTIKEDRWKLILVTNDGTAQSFPGVVIKAEHYDEIIRTGYYTTGWRTKDFELANVELIPKLKSQ